MDTPTPRTWSIDVRYHVTTVTEDIPTGGDLMEALEAQAPAGTIVDAEEVEPDERDRATQLVVLAGAGRLDLDTCHRLVDAVVDGDDEVSDELVQAVDSHRQGDRDGWARHLTNARRYAHQQDAADGERLARAAVSFIDRRLAGDAELDAARDRHPSRAAREIAHRMMESNGRDDD